MKLTKRIISWLTVLSMFIGMLNIPTKVEAAANTDTYVKQLITYYKNNQENASTDIERVLDEMKTIDSNLAEVWSNIMAYWSTVNKSGFVNVAKRVDGNITTNELPTGLEISNDNSVAIVILGYALNSDGTMKDELVGRLQVGLALANQYPNTYVVVTGGGTAKDNPSATEGGVMGEWLLDQGLDEERLIIENRAPDTVGNAKYTYEILNSMGTIDSVVMVTSDYHIPRGSILYYTKFMLAAHELNGNPIEIIENCGYYTGTNGYETISLQASGVSSMAGVSTSGVEVKLSELRGITVKQNTPYSTGKELDLTVLATYDSEYTRDVTEFIDITNFDPSKDANQTITVSYTENGVSATGTLELTETTKYISAYHSLIESLLIDANSKKEVDYTTESYGLLKMAITNSEDVLSNQYSTEKELQDAYDALVKALNNLKRVIKENIALNKPVNVSHNTADAYKITNGVKTDYWAGLENNANVPIENSSIIIDLQGIYAVDELNVTPYYQANNRYYHYNVLLSENGTDWNLIQEYRDTTLCTEAGNTIKLETPVNTRYIKVEGVYVTVNGRPDINNFHVNEIYAYGKLVREIETEKPLTNLALYGKVELDSGTYAHVLTDGKIANSYTASSNGIVNAYAIITLPYQTNVKEFKVVTYYNNMSKWYTFDVLVSNDKENWTSVAKYETEQNVGSAGITLTLDTPVEAKYVKIQGLKTNNTNLHLVEVQVFGEDKNIALGSNVTESHKTNTATSAVDGNLSSYWSIDVGISWANQKEETCPYFVSDLGGLYNIKSMNIMNYYSTSRYYHFKIYTSVDNETWTLFYEKTDDEKSYFSRDILANKETIVRYIKVVGTHNSANSGYHVNELRVDGTVYNESLADYTSVNNAIALIPSNLDIYTTNSVIDLKLVLNSIDYTLTQSQQTKVNEFAQDVLDAIEALELKPADYSKLNVTIQLVNEMDKTLYTNFNDVEKAIEAVVYGLSITEQETVDSFTKAIKDAVAALEYRKADYSKLEELLNSIPSDLSIYTEETVEALEEVLDSIDYELLITEQETVDGYVDVVLAALDGLTVKEANYTKVDEAISKVPTDLTKYTEESVKALNDALEAVVRGLNVIEQETVDGYVDTILKAIDGLVEVQEGGSADTSDSFNITFYVFLLLTSLCAFTELKKRA